MATASDKALKLRNGKDGTVFNHRRYFLDQFEECNKCDHSRPEKPHFHCLVCHVNLEVPKKRNKINHNLKTHYTKMSLYPITISMKEKHDLTKPPRYSVAASFMELTPEDRTMVREAVWAFHTSNHFNSFGGNDCTSKLFSMLFDPDFACSETKTAAIIKGVFGKHARQRLAKELSNARFITISFDGSIIQHTRLLPIFATYFTRSGGLKQRLLNVVALPNEQGRTIAYAISKTLRQHGVSQRKVVAICADNCPTNYGSVERRGTNNVFSYLLREFPSKIIGIGCLAHVLNNAIKNSTTNLPFGDESLEKLLHQLRQHFEGDPSRAHALFSLADELEVKDDKGNKFNKIIPSYSRTRWLSLEPSVKYVMSNFDLLRFYFEDSKTAKLLEEFKDFFSSNTTFPWLAVVRELAENFETVIKGMEKKDLSLIEAIDLFHQLMQMIEERKKNHNLPWLVEESIKH